ncbi:MAG: glutamine-hydrolyzing carbamoyl-phosphate synthase small subunit [Saprospiraceae bacterium]|jgi:carbamoyl-phosphate synthase small subunit|nr:glutamine-hydrolyzing carbamoyl-phosphate synthase small subunit [Saprospiraceae bacterium]MBP6566780.1 glutamine-hydrolyzing carbamoyl-phosphate synthase small subunit [Saprospiraceae bacterium]
MDFSKKDKAVVLFEDGSFFEGSAAGIVGTSTGEVCFNTGMTGYQEIFTDPSYFGQILVTTNAHIGNYGTKKIDTESERVQISGLICKNFTNDYSRPLADLDIQKYFEENNVVCIYDVDTRAIVRNIRDKGAMNCIISSEIFDKEELGARLKKVPSMEGLELASIVSSKEVYDIGNPNVGIKVAVLDFGTKSNILNSLSERGCFLRVFPAKTKLSDIISFNPDGFFLSNGPGDPASMEYAIETVKSLLLTKKPMFGICLGHQILALANGISTFKMHHGHRGANHPVINLDTGKCEITSQNHGFTVSEPDVLKCSDTIEITHRNLNDETVEGIRMRNQPAFSVQYHPEANPGPHDSKYLFDDFVNLLKKAKYN